METIFSCTHCDAQYKKWVGRCLECGKWGTVEEKHLSKKEEEKSKTPRASATMEVASSVKMKNFERIQTNISEFDRTVGFGIVPGSFILLGGEPGIGKSTLCAQIASSVPNSLYFSAEESIQQVGMRIQRLNLNGDTSKLSNETCVEIIASTILNEKPSLAIIDSIQTIYSEEVSGEPGSISQVRASTVKLLEVCKSSGTSVIIIGHVTKDGAVAGPRTLEHLVDTVLYLEGDRYHQMRILRTVKNRFGSTDEIGIFEMEENGLQGVQNPSQNLLLERTMNLSGSVITCLLEGTRPLLVEVQALVNKTAFGYPLRKSSGFDINRLHVLLAVLQKRTNLPFGGYDVHVNIVGGIKANEPAVDLAVCLALASSFKDKALGNDLVVFGEVGLGGEVRSTSHIQKRLKECEHLGMKRIITHLPAKLKIKDTGVNITNVENINELIKLT